MSIKDIKLYNTRLSNARITSINKQLITNSYNHKSNKYTH